EGGRAAPGLEGHELARGEGAQRKDVRLADRGTEGGHVAHLEERLVARRGRVELRPRHRLAADLTDPAAGVVGMWALCGHELGERAEEARVLPVALRREERDRLVGIGAGLREVLPVRLPEGAEERDRVDGLLRLRRDDVARLARS